MIHHFSDIAAYEFNRDNDPQNCHFHHNAKEIILRNNGLIMDTTISNMKIIIIPFLSISTRRIKDHKDVNSNCMAHIVDIINMEAGDRIIVRTRTWDDPDKPGYLLSVEAG